MYKDIICGIYRIKNNVNQKVYIGSSKNCKKRISEHKRKLLVNKHFNAHLQNSYNKYGSKAFSFTIIKVCNAETLRQEERLYIQSLPKSARYNLTEETVNTMDDPAMRLKIYEASVKERGVKVTARNQNGEYFYFDCISDAARYCKTTHCGVYRCLKGIMKSSNNFCFKLGHTNNFPYISRNKLIKIASINKEFVTAKSAVEYMNLEVRTQNKWTVNGLLTALKRDNLYKGFTVNII